MQVEVDKSMKGFIRLKRGDGIVLTVTEAPAIAAVRPRGVPDPT